MDPSLKKKNGVIFRGRLGSIRRGIEEPKGVVSVEIKC
jgi:hypothetical protein